MLGDNKVIDHGEASTPLKSVNDMEKGLGEHEVQTSVFGVFDEKDGPDFSKILKDSNKVTMRWENVCLTINGKEILKNISGRVDGGEMVALLGPSGAGKSSLQNVLAGRILPSKSKVISGNMYVNGESISPFKFRRNIAYVLQQDALFSTSTAREAIEFSAKLRLPSTTSDKERQALVDELIKALGLSHVQNTFCGSELVRGLSGGERKRVSIGVELVTNPSILFLDEPTSGLDSYSSYKVCSIMKSLAKTGCCVLCTIHQPPSEVFSLFDRTILLTRGVTIYQGKVANMPHQLAKLGFPLPPFTNPADFVLVISQTKSLEELPRFNEDDDIESAQQQTDDKSFRDADAPPARDESNMNANDAEASFKTVRAANGMVQMNELALREFRNLSRDKRALIGRFGVTIFMNLLFGLIFYQSGDVTSGSYTLRSHFGALTNLFISGMFGAIQPPMLTFAVERVVFLKEYSVGTYSAVPYFISKIMVEIPLYLAQALVIFLVQYWLVGFQGNFGLLFLSLFLLMVVSASYAFLVGALVPDVKTGQELSPLLFVPQLLFTGFFISISQIPAALAWIQYLCSLKYGLNLGMIVEFGGDNCGNPLQVQACNGLLEENDVDPDLKGLYVGILAGIFVLFRGGSLLALIQRARHFSS